MSSHEIKNEVYKFFADIVFAKTGIFYPEKDYYRLDSRINNLMEKYSFETSDELYHAYKNSKTADMETYLIDICTNNETYFFRDTKPFDALAKDMIPAIQAQYPHETINIWSCASSTGQEPLSIIMSIFENLGSATRFTFDATDISTKALSKAKSGLYTGLDVQRGLPIQLLMKYFEQKEDNEWQAKSEILSKVNYSSFNLFTGPFVPEKYHVIFCRNVLIYQDTENKVEILHKLAKTLKPGGFLILGAGESLIGTKTDLAQKSLQNSMVFQRPNETSTAA
ncbi:MAG: protein-glutamate O-methyltransferase CheR [Halobacteriovoraceae bacterium]|nr:protein-glutamate O-methyltransferase CheR [Halobacteriovoraceae bacterium]